MKHFLLRSSVIFLLLTLMGMNGPEANAEDWSAWSQWTPADCYHNISYRSRTRYSHDNKDYVQMEIKNNFGHGISISHFISNDRNATAIYRIDISQGGVYTSEQYVDNDRPYYLILKKLRFSGDAYGDPYRDCDGKMAITEHKPNTDNSAAGGGNTQQNNQRSKITTDSKTWNNHEEDEDETRQQAAAHGGQRHDNYSDSRRGSHSSTSNRPTKNVYQQQWEAQQAEIQRRNEIRRQEEARMKAAGTQLGEAAVQMATALEGVGPKPTNNWADFYMGYDMGKGLESYRLGLEARTYYGKNTILYFGISGLLTSTFEYYYVDVEDDFSKEMDVSNNGGLELQLGIGSRILGAEENSQNAGYALYWGLLGYVGGVSGGDLAKPDDWSSLNIMGYYGPRLLVGYRMSHISFRASYSLYFTDKRYFLGLSGTPGPEDKHRSGLVQLQLGYSF